ncbi:MAG: SRPBCC family protein [Clostridiales bacterium]
MAVYQFYRKQLISSDLESVWEFISSPQNLKIITPEFLGFQVISKNLPHKIYPGQMIFYELRPLLNMKSFWVTEITHVKELNYFVDEQRIGPYKIWHHEHQLIPANEGIEMIDVITYSLRFGFIGRLIHKPFVLRQLNKIFDYRKQKLEEIFGWKQSKTNQTTEV